MDQLVNLYSAYYTTFVDWPIFKNCPLKLENFLSFSTVMWIFKNVTKTERERRERRWVVIRGCVSLRWQLKARSIREMLWQNMQMIREIKMKNWKKKKKTLSLLMAGLVGDGGVSTRLVGAVRCE